jgi:hypothetical protein
MVLESWDELIERVGHAPGMFVGRPKYSLVRSFVAGFGAGRGDQFLSVFHYWLSDQPQHLDRKNYAWSALLLDEVFPDRRIEFTPKWLQTESPRADEWPRPAPAPMSEDDLVYPDEDAAVISHLFLRLRQFLDSVSDGGTQV